MPLQIKITFENEDDFYLMLGFNSKSESVYTLGQMSIEEMITSLRVPWTKEPIVEVLEDVAITDGGVKSRGYMIGDEILTFESSAEENGLDDNTVWLITWGLECFLEQILDGDDYEDFIAMCG